VMFKRNNKRSSARSKLSLETDSPLCEKDEQGRVMEKMRNFQKQALKLWHALKKKQK
jgi:hypothetical protein